MSKRNRKTLPLLSWLHKNHPDLAQPIARAVIDQKPAQVESVKLADREIRPTVGELMREASDAFRVYVRDGVRHVGKGYRRLGGKTYRDPEWQWLGNLMFYRGELREWGITKKGKKLKPRDGIRGSGKHKRSPTRYLKTKPTPVSPHHAVGIERVPCRPPAGDGPSPFYDPLPGVEKARSELESAMAAYSRPVMKCPTKVAANAYFFGGIVRPKQGTKGGAPMWEAPEKPKGEAAEVIEEVKAGGTLKTLGIRMGYGPDYADRAAKTVLMEAAKVLSAANDNKKEKKIAA